MIGTKIRELQHVIPFEPYTVQTSDGHALYVKHPDYLLITPNDETVYVYANETDYQIIATRNVTRLEPGGRKARGKKRSSGRK